MVRHSDHYPGEGDRHIGRHPVIPEPVGLQSPADCSMVAPPSRRLFPRGSVLTLSCDRTDLKTATGIVEKATFRSTVCRVAVPTRDRTYRPEGSLSPGAELLINS